MKTLNLETYFQRKIFKKAGLLAFLIFAIIVGGILSIHTRMMNHQISRFGNQLEAIVKPLLRESDHFQIQRQLLLYTQNTTLTSAIIVKSPEEVLFSVNKNNEKLQLRDYFINLSTFSNLWSSHLYGSRTFKLFETSSQTYSLLFKLENAPQFYLLLFTLLSIFVLVFSIIFIWGKLIKNFFTKITQPITEMESFLDNYIKNGKLDEEIGISQIQEYQNLFNKFQHFNEQLTINKEIIKKKSFDEALGNVSIQLFHDLRAPLSVLEMACKDIQDDNNKFLATSSLMRIRNMSSKLLDSRRENKLGILDSKKKSYSLSEFISDLKLKWRLINDGRINILFDSLTNLDQELDFDRASLERSVNNLIQNAVDCFEGTQISNPTIKCFFSLEESQLIIKVQDNGPGIPPQVKEMMFKTEVSFGKEKGNGLGLMQIQSFMLQNNGSIDVITHTEAENHGSEISLKLPIDRIHLIQIDDDELVRMAWKLEAKKKNLNIAQFSSFNEFKMNEAEINSKMSKNTPIYIDYSLKETNGIECAQELTAKGHENISLSTGLPRDEFPADLPFNVLDKSFPLGQ